MIESVTTSPPADPIPPLDDPVVAAEAVDGLDPIDAKLARVALIKLQEGKPLHQTEQLALRRYKNHRESGERNRHITKCPVSEVIRATGRQRKVLDGMAEKYNIPFAGAGGDVNLFAVVKATTEWFATHHEAVSVALRDAAGGNLGARLKEVQIKQRQLRLDEDMGRLIPADVVRMFLSDVAGELARTLSTLEREFGADRVQAGREGLARMEKMWKEKLTQKQQG